MSNEVKIKFKFDGGDADEHKLDLYDAGVAIHGLARSLAISLHAFLNDGEIRSKVNKIDGATLYISPSRKGSWEEIITIVVGSAMANNIGQSVLSNAIWDFIKYTFSRATNQPAEVPNNRYTKKLLKDAESFESDISMALERPLEMMHRPLASQSKMKITITKNQTEEKIEFTQETLNYVTTNEEPKLAEGINGHVTRYNILTGNGRFYDDSINKIIPFSLDQDMPENDKKLLTQSMDRRIKELEGNGKIKIDANRIVNKARQTKRYVIVSVHAN